VIFLKKTILKVLMEIIPIKEIVRLEGWKTE